MNRQEWVNDIIEDIKDELAENEKSGYDSVGPMSGDAAKALLGEFDRFHTERNAMAEYLSGMPCPYHCEQGMIFVPASTIDGEYSDQETDCPHCTKLRELNITEK